MVQRVACVVIALAVAPIAARGENVLALAGFDHATSTGDDTYGWQFEVQEPLFQQLSVSLSWLNEGHISRHRRDGAAAQLWFNSPMWFDRLQFSIGAGPYIYFDTEQESTNRGYSDVHSAAGAFSASLSLDLSKSWFLALNVNAIYAPGDVNSLGVLFGGGYHFGASERSESTVGTDADADTPNRRQQIQLLLGETIQNDLDFETGSSEQRTAGLEYRLALTRWVAWSATWFHEFDVGQASHDQAATQLWVVDSLPGGRFSLGAGVGIYVPLESPQGGVPGGTSPLSGLSGLRVEWNLSPRSSLIVTWYRSFTRDDSDCDIITLGYGFRL
jgi:hypothetical protein